MSQFLSKMEQNIDPIDFQKVADGFAFSVIGMLAPFTARMQLINMVNMAHDKWEAHNNEE